MHRPPCVISIAVRSPSFDQAAAEDSSTDAWIGAEVPSPGLADQLRALEWLDVCIDQGQGGTVLVTGQPASCLADTLGCGSHQQMEPSSNQPGVIAQCVSHLFHRLGRAAQVTLCCLAEVHGGGSTGPRLMDLLAAPRPSPTPGAQQTTGPDSPESQAAGPARDLGRSSQDLGHGSQVDQQALGQMCVDIAQRTLPTLVVVTSASQAMHVLSAAVDRKARWAKKLTRSRQSRGTPSPDSKGGQSPAPHSSWDQTTSQPQWAEASPGSRTSDSGGDMPHTVFQLSWTHIDIRSGGQRAVTVSFCMTKDSMTAHDGKSATQHGQQPGGSDLPGAGAGPRSPFHTPRGPSMQPAALPGALLSMLGMLLASPHCCLGTAPPAQHQHRRTHSTDTARHAQQDAPPPVATATMPGDSHPFAETGTGKPLFLDLLRGSMYNILLVACLQGDAHADAPLLAQLKWLNKHRTGLQHRPAAAVRQRTVHAIQQPDLPPMPQADTVHSGVRSTQGSSGGTAKQSQTLQLDALPRLNMASAPSARGRQPVAAATAPGSARAGSATSVMSATPVGDGAATPVASRRRTGNIWPGSATGATAQTPTIASNRNQAENPARMRSRSALPALSRHLRQALDSSLASRHSDPVPEVQARPPRGTLSARRSSSTMPRTSTATALHRPGSLTARPASASAGGSRPAPTSLHMGPDSGAVGTGRAPGSVTPVSMRRTTGGMEEGSRNGVLVGPSTMELLREYQDLWSDWESFKSVDRPIRQTPRRRSTDSNPCTPINSMGGTFAYTPDTPTSAALFQWPAPGTPPTPTQQAQLAITASLARLGSASGAPPQLPRMQTIEERPTVKTPAPPTPKPPWGVSAHAQPGHVAAKPASSVTPSSARAGSSGAGAATTPVLARAASSSDARPGWGVRQKATTTAASTGAKPAVAPPATSQRPASAPVGGARQRQLSVPQNATAAPAMASSGTSRAVSQAPSRARMPPSVHPARNTPIAVLPRSRSALPSATAGTSRPAGTGTPTAAPQPGSIAPSTTAALKPTRVSDPASRPAAHGSADKKSKAAPSPHFQSSSRGGGLHGTAQQSNSQAGSAPAPPTVLHLPASPPPAPVPRLQLPLRSPQGTNNLGPDWPFLMSPLHTQSLGEGSDGQSPIGPGPSLLSPGIPSLLLTAQSPVTSAALRTAGSSRPGTSAGGAPAACAPAAGDKPSGGGVAASDATGSRHRRQLSTGSVTASAHWVTPRTATGMLSTQGHPAGPTSGPQSKVHTTLPVWSQLLAGPSQSDWLPELTASPLGPSRTKSGARRALSTRTSVDTTLPAAGVEVATAAAAEDAWSALGATTSAATKPAATSTEGPLKKPHVQVPAFRVSAEAAVPVEHAGRFSDDTAGVNWAIGNAVGAGVGKAGSLKVAPSASQSHGKRLPAQSCPGTLLLVPGQETHRTQYSRSH